MTSPPAARPGRQQSSATCGAAALEGSSSPGPAAAPKPVLRKLRIFQNGDEWWSEWKQPNGKLVWLRHATAEDAMGAH